MARQSCGPFVNFRIPDTVPPIGPKATFSSSAAVCWNACLGNAPEYATLYSLLNDSREQLRDGVPEIE